MRNTTKRASKAGLPRRRLPPGTPPGTIVVDPAAPDSRISLIAYGPDSFKEGSDIAKDEIDDWRGTALPVLWIDVVGLGDEQALKLIGERFGLHTLALEDVVNVHQRPKLDEYDEHLFIVARMPSTTFPLRSEQVSLFLGQNFVITFQERPGDCFEPIRERIRSGAGRIRNLQADYLAYALLDAVTDGYFPVLERVGERMDALEDVIMFKPEADDVRKIHALRRDLLQTRRAVWPYREMLNQLVRDDSPYISAGTKIYLRDCSDHAFQLIDLIETYREMVSDLSDVFLSAQSIRMNEIMKVLTVIATIFMPLTLITGIYGMNFDRKASEWNMPELGWPFGYPIVMAVMFAIGIGMLVYFQRRGWVGKQRHRTPRRRKRDSA